MKNNRQPLLNAREAIEYLGISLSTLSRIEKQGLIVPFRTPGGHRRYDVEMLEQYLESSREPSRDRRSDHDGQRG
jgi:predicted site-specific integrase-resolvase